MISEVLELGYFYNYIAIRVIKGIPGKNCSYCLKQKSQHSVWMSSHKIFAAAAVLLLLAFYHYL